MKIILFFNLILEIVKYILAGEVIFKRHISRKCVFGGFIAIIGVILAISVTNNVENLSLFVIPIMFIVLLVTLDGTCRSRIAYLFKLIILILYMDYFIELFMKLFSPIEIKSETGWLVSNILSIVLYVSIYLMQKIVKRCENTQLGQIGMAIMYVGIAMMTVAIPLTIADLNVLSKKYNNAVNVKKTEFLSAMTMLGIVSLVLLVIYIYDTNKKMKKFLDIEMMLKETQKKYYEALIQKEKETKKFRHDVSNHIMCIRELAAREEVAAVKKYIDDIQGKIQTIQKSCYSVGNIVLDAVLNQYMSQLPDDVAIKVSGFLQEQLPISDVELCTVFSNLMRNSVEELQQQVGDKYITVKVHAGENDFILEICNSANGQKKGNRNGLPQTLKKKREEHGYGLRNVKETIEKNNGIFQWESTTENFKVKVMLPLRSRG